MKSESIMKSVIPRILGRYRVIALLGESLSKKHPCLYIRRSIYLSLTCFGRISCRNSEDDGGLHFPLFSCSSLLISDYISTDPPSIPSEIRRVTVFSFAPCPLHHDPALLHYDVVNIHFSKSSISLGKTKSFIEIDLICSCITPNLFKSILFQLVH